MKKVILRSGFPIGLFVLFLINTSCNFNKSYKSNLSTGMVAVGDGISVKDIEISSEGKSSKDNVFTFGERVVFNFSNVKGFKEVNGLKYPGLKTTIIKNNSDTLVSSQNLLTNLVNGTDFDPLLLTANISAVFPHNNKEQYKVNVHIWDFKGDGVYNYSYPFTVESTGFIEEKQQGLSCENIYLWNESTQKCLFASSIKKDDDLYVIYDKFEGFEIVGELVYPTLLVEVTDGLGNLIIQSDNALPQYSEGINSEEFLNGSVPLSLEWGEGKVASPCTIRTVLKDEKSGNTLETHSSIEIL